MKEYRKHKSEVSLDAGRKTISNHYAEYKIFKNSNVLKTMTMMKRNYFEMCP